MPRIVPVALSLAALLGLVCSADSGAPMPRPDPIRVSLLQLVATPERYEGKRVRVRGFCHLEFEEQSLYLHKEDSEIVNTANALWLEIDPSKVKEPEVSEHFVIVEGVFTGESHGHLGAWSGEIRDITRLERELTRSEFRLISQWSKKDVSR